MSPHECPSSFPGESLGVAVKRRARRQFIGGGRVASFK